MAKRATERVLCFGDSGVGKSRCWVDIADQYHKAGLTDVRFHVIDTDDNWDRYYDEGYGHLEDAGIVVPYYPYGFDELREVSAEVRAKVVRGRDWIVNDMASGWYDDAKANYAQQVYGVDYADYMVTTQAEVFAYKEALKARGEKGGHDKDFGGFGNKEWPIIRDSYLRVELPLTQKSGCNVFTVVEEKSTGHWTDEETKAAFAKVGGMMPRGHAGLRHRHHTVIRMTKKADDSREITVQKDRQREHVWKDRAHRGRTIVLDAENGFYKQYMLKIAGRVIR